MKKTTIIGMVVIAALIIGGAVYAGTLLAKPKTVLTDATVVRAEMPVGAWGLILSTVERNAVKLGAPVVDSATKRTALDSIGLAANTLRKALTDQNEILKTDKK